MKNSLYCIKKRKWDLGKVLYIIVDLKLAFLPYNTTNLLYIDTILWSVILHVLVQD